jgi:NAD-dependent deacetylase
MTSFLSEIERAAVKLRSARSVVVFTGAGVSAESGLPTFRSGAGAMWKDVDVSRYATPRGYREHSKDAWQWYAMRAQAAASVEPNAGHLAIVEIEWRAPEFVLITQNIDGLHHRAGSRKVVELHGNLRKVRCFDCGAFADWPTQSADPVCVHCGGLLRPDVVFFEEDLPVGALQRARAATLRCSVLIAVGTSNLVWPARELPDLALGAGAHVLIVNVDMDGQLPAGDRVIHLEGRAGDVLPRLTRLAWESG